MKKIILLVIICYSLMIDLPVSAATWLNCPFGQVNDPYPGLCARYTDTDADGFCDNSQPAPEEKTGNIKIINNQQKNMTKYYVLEITVILLLLYGLSKYLVYYSQQSKNKFLKQFNSANLRYAMNSLLLASFLLALITALGFLARVKFGWLVESKINFSWWHVEFGWIMAVVSLIHVVERWRYFVARLKK